MKFKGICYQPFPPPYNPSTANTTCIFFGSDIAYDAMAPLWGPRFTPSNGQTLDPARNDLQTLRDMGVNLVRLYDWEPRNRHWNFLDRCQELGIQVLAPASNYFLREGFGSRDQHIPELIRSFASRDGKDYHPAVAGIILGNEPGLNGISTQNVIDFTRSWAQIEARSFNGFRQLPIGHPVDFSTYGGELPCWGFWAPLLQALGGESTRNLGGRLFLAPQTYNEAEYLFRNARGGRGYFDLSFERFAKPMLVAEIGQDRTKNGYLDIVAGQLQGALAYGQAHPERLWGVCHFQFADKVWMQGTSEGSFGTHSHTAQKFPTVTYSGKDFTHWDVNCDGNTLTPNHLARNPVCDVIERAYR